MKKSTRVYKDKIIVTIGRNVKYYRDKLGLSQEKVAERCGDPIHRNFVGRIERCELNLSVLQLARLAKGLEVTIIDLLTDHSTK
jgi:transcriptional regulator with XRE-family HTH domain